MVELFSWMAILFIKLYFIMDNIKYSIILYNSLGKNKVKNRVDIITDLFKIDRSTFYRWFNEYNQQFINHKNFYD